MRPVRAEGGEIARPHPIADPTELKSRLHAVWAAGDYARIAEHLTAGATAFLERIPHAPGDRLLDIGCGAGQLALLAARRGVRAEGVDIVEPLVAEARRRAEAEGLPARFQEGDAEDLPVADGAFDIVASLIGAMFAPRPERVAAEMLRACRPGGTIAMANWTPDGFIGRFFRTVGAHVPPPDMPSPLLWGDAEVVRERFGDGLAEMSAERTTYPFRYDMPPEEVVALFSEYFGPVVRARAALDAEGRAALEADLLALWREANQAGAGKTAVDAGILEVVARRA